MIREEILEVAKPILFNTEMVKAILEGRKTVTRRVIKFCINKFTGEIPTSNELKLISKTDSKKVSFATENDIAFTVNAPYQVGDYLYVRETWDVPYNPLTGYAYRASCRAEASHLFNWHPSIHMPKEAARIFLQVTNVKAKRLQDMNADDAEKEGIYFVGASPSIYMHEFIKLWNSTINKKDMEKYGWNANPWVWIYEFEEVKVDE